MQASGPFLTREQGQAHVDQDKRVAKASEAAKVMTEPPKRHWTTYVGQAAGHPAAFLVVILYAVLWLTFSPATFEWNAIATLAVFVMTLFIQRPTGGIIWRFTRNWMNFCASTATHVRSLPSSTNRNRKQSSVTATRKCERPPPEPNQARRRLTITAPDCLKFPHRDQAFKRNERRVSSLFRRNFRFHIPMEKRRGNSCRLRHRLSLLPGNPDAPDAEH
jgi:hypothetical protein